MSEGGAIIATLGTVIDTLANSNTSHGFSTGVINAAYNPATQFLGAIFYGYNGGDTLSVSGPEKLYILETIRLNMKTAAQGVY
jgi:hypothetical protein